MLDSKINRANPRNKTTIGISHHFLFVLINPQSSPRKPPPDREAAAFSNALRESFFMASVVCYYSVRIASSTFRVVFPHDA